MDLFEDLSRIVRERVLGEAFLPLGEAKDETEAWWDNLPGKRKNKVLKYLGLPKSEKRLFAKLAASNRSELEAYFIKHKGKVEWLEKMSGNFELSEAIAQSQIKRGEVYRKDTNLHLGSGASEHGLNRSNLIGWFANKYNMADGWTIFDTTSSEKREFGRDALRTYDDNKKSVNIAKFNLKKGTYAFLDSKAYEEGEIRYERPSVYNRVRVVDSPRALKAFGVSKSYDEDVGLTEAKKKTWHDDPVMLKAKAKEQAKLENIELNFKRKWGSTSFKNLRGAMAAEFERDLNSVRKQHEKVNDVVRKRMLQGEDVELTEAKGRTFYFKGDKVQYTGKSEKMYGKMFYEFEYLEGRKKGQKGHTPNSPNVRNPGIGDQTEDVELSEGRKSNVPDWWMDKFKGKTRKLELEKQKLLTKMLKVMPGSIIQKEIKEKAAEIEKQIQKMKNEDVELGEERNISGAKKYINRIRNTKKKAYANAYLKWILKGGVHPDGKDFGLGYMGAQSVRLDFVKEFGLSPVDEDVELTEARTRKWYWVENDKEKVLFVGLKTKALSYYKNNGGSAGGLHLMSAHVEIGDYKYPKPVVGKVYESTGLHEAFFTRQGWQQFRVANNMLGNVESNLANILKKEAKGSSNYRALMKLKRDLQDASDEFSGLERHMANMPRN